MLVGCICRRALVLGNRRLSPIGQFPVSDSVHITVFGRQLYFLIGSHPSSHDVLQKYPLFQQNLAIDAR